MLSRSMWSEATIEEARIVALRVVNDASMGPRALEVARRWLSAEADDNDLRWLAGEAERQGRWELGRKLRAEPPEWRLNAAAPAKLALPSVPTLTRLDEVKTRAVGWLWRPWIPLGAVTILDGQQGAKKSTLLGWVAARASRGELAVGPDADAGPHATIVLSAEEDADVDLKPRFERADADLTRICAVDGIHALDDEDERQRLAAFIQQEDARLVIIDPIEAFAGRTNLNGNAEARRGLMTPLKALAAAHNCAIVLVRHLNKKTDLPAQYRGGGSVGIAAASRSHLGLGRHPEKEDHIALVAFRTSRVREPDPAVFRIVPDPFSLKHVGSEDLDPDEVMGARARHPQATTGPKARVFLLRELANGRRRKGELVEKFADEQDLSKDAARRALEKVPDIDRDRTLGWGLA